MTDIANKVEKEPFDLIAIPAHSMDAPIKYQVNKIITIPQFLYAQLSRVTYYAFELLARVNQSLKEAGPYNLSLLTSSPATKVTLTS